MFDIVQSAFEANDVESLEEIYKDLIAPVTVDASRKSSVEELLCAINSTECSISRHVGAEIFIPKAVREQEKMCTAIR